MYRCREVWIGLRGEGPRFDVFRRAPRRGQAAHALRWHLGGRLLLEPTRSPFSALAGDPTASHDDNGWLFAVGGRAHALPRGCLVRPPTVCTTAIS